MPHGALQRLPPSRSATAVSKQKPSYPDGSAKPHAPPPSPGGSPCGAGQAGESGRAEEHGAAGRQLHGEQHQGHQAARREDGSSDRAHVGDGAGQLAGVGAPHTGGGSTADAANRHQNGARHLKTARIQEKPKVRRPPSILDAPIQMFPPLSAILHVLLVLLVLLQLTQQLHGSSLHLQAHQMPLGVLPGISSDDPKGEKRPHEEVQPRRSSAHQRAAGRTQGGQRRWFNPTEEEEEEEEEDDLRDSQRSSKQWTCWVLSEWLASQPTVGATIKRNEITGEIFIARVIHGGLADRSGLLHAGDRIIEVNGFPVDGMEPEQVIQVVQARSQGTIMFKVVPITERPVHNQTMLYVRAMADYSPQQDPTIPCADAGMSFRKGDVLEIVDQTDALWWQAKKLPSNTACAGLIPSTNLLKRKQREFWWSQPYQPHACIQTLSTVEEEEDLMALDEKCVEADEETFESEELRDEEDDFSSNIEGVYLVGFRRSMRLCRRRSHSTTQPSCHTRCPSSCYSALNSPYEEVVRYQRHPEDAHRLIALLGPSGVGVNELRRRLVEMNPNIFQGAIPYTTRAPRGYEESGREYFFTSREVFDNMVYNNRFVEYGEYKGTLYGTSIESVRDVLDSGKICVIDIEPNAIQAVRTHELRAYVIYIKPPPLERLRETRQDSFITTNYYVNRPFKDEDFQEMEEAARKMELHYSQFFDYIIVNDELQDSCVQLLTAVRKAQDEPQWVPASWIRPTAES
uniref:MAGUK p55 scaffold protein 4, like n=1 Tax=Acanthochromis polyacanthus TaxID=80966 RepID=A0A3Q1H0A6_9TELE